MGLYGVSSILNSVTSINLSANGYKNLSLIDFNEIIYYKQGVIDNINF